MRIDIFLPYASVPAITTGVGSITTALTRGSTVRVFNNSTFPVWVRFGSASVVATANDIGIPPNGVELFSVSSDTFQDQGVVSVGATFIAAISPGGAGSLSVTTGEGA